MPEAHIETRSVSELRCERSSATRQEERELIRATHAFAREHRRASWFHLTTALLLLVGAGWVAASAVPWPVRILASTLMALCTVRTFILFHDFQHGAILGRSRLASILLGAFGLLMVTPGRVWRTSHNYHHAHTARTDGRHYGSFTLFTTSRWSNATRFERLAYAAERHPLTIALGYFTVFLLCFGFAPFLRSPKRHFDSGLAIVAHASLGALIWSFAGPTAFVFAFAIPFLVAGALGAYLFYVQHAFDGAQAYAKQDWRHVPASLQGSSYLALSPVMQWFTGNIGFHHVHHLNPKIPFYRLPEAMNAIPALQAPNTVKLNVRSIRDSFRLKLWDEERGEMTGYPARPGPVSQGLGKGGSA